MYVSTNYAVMTTDLFLSSPKVLPLWKKCFTKCCPCCKAKFDVLTSSKSRTVSVLYLAHLVLWEVAPVIHVDSFPCSYIFIVAICYVCHIMKTQLYFRPNLRCKCVVLQEGGSWTGCRGARCRGARDGHLRLWYQGRKHHPLNRKFRVFFGKLIHLGVFNLPPPPQLPLKKGVMTPMYSYTTYFHICIMYVQYLYLKYT